ncbi:autotransporter domain-containing protein [Pseudomonas guineae]|uniref:autotransporter family protein n=1 Tax=Pseudomonas guineae TaxID=425504 RepID=UPI001FCA3B4C|nr:autotransporter domain-containing protein [Pseudomonas guineae]
MANLTGTGSIVNNTNTNASLLTKGTTDFGGVIADGTGSGLTSLNVTSGTTTLTGANTYSGGTTVSGGTLQGSSTSLQGNILNNAMVNFEQATDGTYAGVMSGTGSLSKTGAGALTLSGTNTYSGATLVNGGLLTVNGSIANSAVTLSSGGRLGGTGTFGSMIVNDGVLAPGNSIGTQTVNGNLTLSGASTYEVETDPAGSSSDLVQVNGVANLGGQVRHVGESGTYLPFSTYTILSATGGFAGSSFAGVTSDFAFLTPSLTYDLNNVYLNLQRNNTAVADLAQSRNQLATAGALDSLPAGGALQVALLGLKTNEVPDALNALSGEVYASTAGALLQNSQAFSNSLLQRSGRLLDESQRSALPLWIETQGATRRNDGDSNSAEATQRGGSVAVGGELAMPNDWILGGAFRYGDHRLSVDQLSSHADIDSYSVGLYGRWAQPLDGGSLRMTLGGIYGRHSIDAERDIYTTGLQQSLNSDYDAISGQVFAELGYAMDVGSGIQLEPYVGLSWTQVASDSFTEKGGNAALQADSQNEDMTASTLGLRSQLPLSNGRFNLDAGLAWQHNFSDVNPDAELNFVGSSNFTVDGASMGRDTALLDLGASYRIAPAVTVRAGYSGQFGNNVSSNGGNLTLSWEL